MAKKKRQQQGTHALQVLEAADAAYELVEYEHSEHQDHGYALDTAEVLGRDPATIFKTLMALVDGKPVCAVVPATGMLNLKALAKAASGKRAEMMEPAKAEKQTGYVTGGISPLGQRTKVPTFIDASARDHETMLVSGGKRTLSVSIAPETLGSLVDAAFASIADIERHF
ncbi:Cys-tRNA(Pro) deacylase [Ancrocorticia populi]|uniref:Cys-tRNA(Pro)/Cys-tRNA(Cys) deacylase n=1 Tax=Ancrocorticia populi TaxID=2175228 RepID=A0A2V1K4B1_9ACTO|nr:Cys-tRNA(Pro) deacylase [Ancrocorticia populi]PWF26115.1 Cys-tRNA(Pro) deacylase [Ancrocorticia populi]